jgi:hypothetical protein
VRRKNLVVGIATAAAMAVTAAATIAVPAIAHSVKYERVAR